MGLAGSGIHAAAGGPVLRIAAPIATRPGTSRRGGSRLSTSKGTTMTFRRPPRGSCRAEPRFTTARLDGVCPETGLPIKRGDCIAWYPSSRRAYHESSPSARALRGMQFAAAWNMADANH